MVGDLVSGRDCHFDGVRIADLRSHAENLRLRGIDRTMLTIDELDALLDAAAERDELKAELVDEIERTITYGPPLPKKVTRLMEVVPVYASVDEADLPVYPPRP